jgi:5-methylcytosine-specific restriction endonuclease McrA
MPFQTAGKRDYKKELNWEKTSKPKRVKQRAERNKARAIMATEGKVKKGDGKDVDHKTPLSKGGKTTRSNLRVQTATKNRSFKRKSNGAIK